MRFGLFLPLVLVLASQPAWAGGVPGFFTRGDANADGAINLTDVIRTVTAVFGTGAPLECPDAADANDDGALNVADPVMLLSYLFDSSVSALPAPFPAAGLDPTADALFCGCASEQDLNTVLAFIMGSFSLCAPAFPLDLGIATVQVCNQLEPACAPQPGCPITVTVVSVAYDAATTTLTIDGELAIDPITFDTGGVLGTCTGDITAEFSVAILAITSPVGTDGVQFDDFDVTTTVPDLQLNLVTGAACFVINPALALLQGFLIDQATALIDMTLVGLIAPNLTGLVVCNPTTP
ncbi:MAG: hypothetical protein AB7I09_20265 [Planctomycetota bacterium]